MIDRASLLKQLYFELNRYYYAHWDTSGIEQESDRGNGHWPPHVAFALFPPNDIDGGADESTHEVPFAITDEHPLFIAAANLAQTFGKKYLPADDPYQPGPSLKKIIAASDQQSGSLIDDTDACQSRSIDDETYDRVHSARGRINRWIFAVMSDPGRLADGPNQETESNNGDDDDHSPMRKPHTARGEAELKVIAAFSKHHRYQEAGQLNLVPIRNNALARMADVAPSTVSAFFKKHFDGPARYKNYCADEKTLLAALKLLNGDFSPAALFGRIPPGEGARPQE